MLALPSGHEPIVLSLNVPAREPKDVLGLVFARTGNCGHFDLLPTDGDSHYRLGARQIDAATIGDCDGSALDAGYAVLTPLHVEMTDMALMERLKKDWKE